MGGPAVLVTGAGGKTGREATRALSRRGARVRALVRRAEYGSRGREAAAAEVAAGDMRRASVLAGALAGVDAVYHICPNMHPGEVEIGRLVLREAARAGVERFVFHSVLHPQTEKMPHHWNKLRVEELIFESIWRTSPRPRPSR